MTIQIKHPFVSAKGDGGDATLVRPSNWNAVHSTSMASGQLVGRLTAGVGVFEEIPISAYMAGLLAATDANALAGLLGLWTTGDVKYTFCSVAQVPAGWLSLSQAGSSNGLTIGNAASGGNVLASATAQALFVLIYTNCSDANAPVSGGRTGNALNDFNANKTLTIPQLGGRSPIGAGQVGTGTSIRIVGQQYGEENHAITVAELAVHYHSASIYDPGHSHSYTRTTSSGAGVTGGGSFPLPDSVQGGILTSSNATNVRVNSSNGLDTTYSAGSGTAHNTVHPVTALNIMVKL
jgi:microcystin-dependent protein